MTFVDLKQEIENDIERYSAMIKRFKSGEAKAGDVDGQGQVTDRSAEMIAHLETVIERLKACL